MTNTLFAVVLVVCTALAPAAAAQRLSPLEAPPTERIERARAVAGAPALGVAGAPALGVAGARAPLDGMSRAGLDQSAGRPHLPEFPGTAHGAGLVRPALSDPTTTPVNVPAGAFGQDRSPCEAMLVSMAYAMAAAAQREPVSVRSPRFDPEGVQRARRALAGLMATWSRDRVRDAIQELGARWADTNRRPPRSCNERYVARSVRHVLVDFARAARAEANGRSPIHRRDRRDALAGVMAAIAALPAWRPTAAQRYAVQLVVCGATMGAAASLVSSRFPDAAVQPATVRAWMMRIRQRLLAAGYSEEADVLRRNDRQRTSPQRPQAYSAPRVGLVLVRGWLGREGPYAMA